MITATQQRERANRVYNMYKTNKRFTAQEMQNNLNIVESHAKRELKYSKDLRNIELLTDSSGKRYYFR
jgi:predicted transcriptional regulator